MGLGKNNIIGTVLIKTTLKHTTHILSEVVKTTIDKHIKVNYTPQLEA